MDYLREQDIPALAKLKAQYDPMAEKFRTEAMALVQDALKGKGIDMSQTEAAAAKAKPTCGFCRICVTDCATCVYGAPSA